MNSNELLLELVDPADLFYFNQLRCSHKIRVFTFLWECMKLKKLEAVLNLQNIVPIDTGMTLDVWIGEF